MVAYVLEIISRNKTGKGASRAIRRMGMVPGIIYGDNKKVLPFSIDPRIVMRHLRLGHFFSQVYALKMNGKTVGNVLAKDLQLHPVTGNPWHIDFMRVSPKMRVTLTIPIRFTGEDVCPGIKEGGLLNIVRHGIEVICSPDHILEEIVFDLSQINIGDSIRLNQLNLPDSVVPTIQGHNVVIATVMRSHVDETDQEEQNNSF